MCLVLAAVLTAQPLGQLRSAASKVLHSRAQGAAWAAAAGGGSPTVTPAVTLCPFVRLRGGGERGSLAARPEQLGSR